MDQAARAAYVIAQAACATAEIEAMRARNLVDVAAERPPFYNFDDFMAVQEKYCIGHNAVIEYLR